MIKNKVSNIRIAIIVTAENEDIELIVPHDLWKRAGLIVDTISIEKKNTLFLESGIKISCNDSIEKTNINKYNAIYLPGGSGSGRYFSDKSDRLAKKLVQFATDEKKWLFAGNEATLAIIKNNAIIDQKLTTIPEAEELLGSHFIDQDIVLDKNFITFRGIANVFKFSLLVIDTLLKDKKITSNVEKDIMYKK